MSKSIKHFYKTHSDSTLFILACFILFWPLAIFLLWKNKKWSLKARSVVTSIFVGFTLLLGIIGYNAPPYKKLSNASISTGYKTDDGYTVIAGEISMLHNPVLLINDKAVTLGKNGDFTHKLTLSEGDTEVRIVAKSDKGVDTKQFKVHRTTAAEFAERKLIAEKEASEKKRIAEAEAVEKKKVAEARAIKANQEALKAMPICNGTTVKAKCILEGVVYKTYVYHPAVAEKSHTETTTTYREEIAGYCTLCADGSYSPTCATGRGACSHHGGVAQWNAPRMRNVPVTTSNIVVDAPAQAEFYEKITE
jgi:hypothetical protein